MRWCYHYLPTFPTSHLFLPSLLFASLLLHVNFIKPNESVKMGKLICLSDAMSSGGAGGNPKAVLPFGFLPTKSRNSASKPLRAHPAPSLDCWSFLFYHFFSGFLCTSRLRNDLKNFKNQLLDLSLGFKLHY